MGLHPDGADWKQTGAYGKVHGADWEGTYGSSGMVTIGPVCEHVTGICFERLLREMLFDRSRVGPDYAQGVQFSPSNLMPSPYARVVVDGTVLTQATEAFLQSNNRFRSAAPPLKPAPLFDHMRDDTHSSPDLGAGERAFGKVDKRTARWTGLMDIPREIAVQSEAFGNQAWCHAGHERLSPSEQKRTLGQFQYMCLMPHSGGMTTTTCGWAAFMALMASYDYCYACTGMSRENWEKVPKGFGGACGYTSGWGVNPAKGTGFCDIENSSKDRGPAVLAVKQMLQEKYDIQI